MTRLSTLVALAIFFTSCNKENIDASQNQIINCAPLAVDPVNLKAAEIDSKNDVYQFIYPAIELQKSTSVILADTITKLDVAKYQLHVYLFTAGRYYLLPNFTTGNNSYNFSVQKNLQFTTANIIRSTGVTENLNAIVVIAVSLNNLKKQEYVVDYSSLATVKAEFGLP